MEEKKSILRLRKATSIFDQESFSRAIIQPWIKALVSLSVLFSPKNPTGRPLQSLCAAFGDHYYMCRFQKTYI
ncbi:hypothetical protein ACET3Z_021815 [Daucus carota]